MKKKIVILASGGGSNLQAMLDAMREKSYPAEAVLVFSNKKDSGALLKAKVAGVPIENLDPLAFENRVDYDFALVERLKRVKPDFICLAGYMLILSPAFIHAFQGRIVNIHPALLPKYGGKGMYGHHVHEAVLASGDTVSGATVHWVEEGVDTGKTILQATVPVEKGDDTASLAARVLKLEHHLYPEALKRICTENA